ncbi:MAG: hypothetical protein AAGE65_10400 [Planctomycetota bacterium]
MSSAVVLPASAQVTGYRFYRIPKPADIAPGFNTFDVYIDFEGEYSGTQILAYANTGYFFTPSGGSDGPPTEFVLSLVPEVAFDTFFAQGGLTHETTVGTLTIGAGGGPVNIDPELTNSVVTSTRIEIQYNPSGADFIADRKNFLIARITISDDFNGSFLFFSSANGDLPDPISLPIVGGFVPFPDIPEPAGAAVAMGLGFALLARTGRGGRRAI